MDPELSDSDSDDFDECLLQQDHLNLLRALGSPLRKVPANLPRVQEADEAAETDDPQQGEDVPSSDDDVLHAAASQTPGSDQQRAKQHLVAQRDAMQSALKANRDLQKHLKMVGEQIAQLMQDNERHIASIIQLRKSTGPKRGELVEQQQLGSSAIGPSRFWVKGDKVPEQNDDAKALLPYYHYLPHRFEHLQPWTADNCNDLQAQVLLLAKDERTETLIEESHSDMTAMLKAVHGMTLQSPGINDIVKNWSDEFWQDRISPINGRSGKDNRIHWNNHCSPATNDAEWSQEEEAELLEIANQHFHRNWEAVAEALGTGRTAMACFLQVKKSEQLTQGRGAFTDEEQQRIREGITLYGLNWAEIASHVGGGRNRQQVMHHFKNVMDVTRKGRWTEEEDRQLSHAVSIVGDRKMNRWSSIAEMVHGRSQTQCRERWCNVLDPTVKTGTPWSKHEVALLKAAVQQYEKPNGSIKWAAVASHLPGRTDSECSRQNWRLNGREPRSNPPKRTKSSLSNTAGSDEPDAATASVPGGTAAVRGA